MDNTKIIGGRTFSFGHIPPLEAVGVEVAVARVIGEPLFKAFMDSKTANADEKKTADQAGAAAIGMMLAKMDAKELTTTMTTVFQYVNCDGKRVEINATFIGRNKELWLVFVEALRFNFSDFLPDGLFASLQSAMPK